MLKLHVFLKKKNDIKQILLEFYNCITYLFILLIRFQDTLLYSTYILSKVLASIDDFLTNNLSY